MGGGVQWSYLYNSLVYNNKAGSWGGGLNDSHAHNYTIVGNHAKGGGGLSVGGQWTSYNCIIYYNSATIKRVSDINVNASRKTAAVYNSCSPDLIHGIDGNITNDSQGV